MEADVFARRRDDHFESDESFAAFQWFLDQNPTCGDVIPSCGGARKVRWSGRGKGKRAGVRVIYLHVPEAARILLVHVYHKSEETDLSADDRRDIAALSDTYRRTLKPEQPKGESS